MSARRAALRVERDALGAVELPADALYGVQTARALANLGFSGKRLGSYPLYVRALAQVKHAAARANAAAGVLPPRLAGAIARATRTLINGELLEHFPSDVLGGGGSIGIHMNVNEVLANLANERLGGRRGIYSPVDPKRHVNASQSTADVCHTAARLAIVAASPELLAALDGALTRLKKSKLRFGAVPTLARTCLRDAMPTTYATLLGGYIDLLSRRRSELARSFAPLPAVTLGGTVIGTGEGAPADYRRRVVSELSQVVGTKLRRHRHPADALQNSDDLGALSAQLAQLAQALIKIAADLRLLSSGPAGGFGEIDLPHVQQGSSFFAGKSNPVVPETVMQCGFQVLGCDRAVQAAVERAELHLNVFDGAAAINVMDALGMLTGALKKLDQRCLQGMRVEERRCRELAAARA